MVMVVAHSRTTLAGISQRFRMACLTLPTHFLQNSLSTQGAPPAPAIVEAKDTEANQGGVVEDSEGGGGGGGGGCCFQGIEFSFIC